MQTDTDRQTDRHIGDRKETEKREKKRDRKERKEIEMTGMADEIILGWLSTQSAAKLQLPWKPTKRSAED